MTETLSFRVRTSSSASRHAIFQKIADGGEWARWLRPVIMRSEWETEGEPAPGGVGAVRKLGTWPIFVRERVVEHEPDRRHVYTMVGDGPISDYRGEVTLLPRPDGGTDVDWRGSFVAGVPGTGTPTLILLRATVRLICHRLVRAAERAEQPSARAD